MNLNVKKTISLNSELAYKAYELALKSGLNFSQLVSKSLEKYCEGFDPSVEIGIALPESKLKGLKVKQRKLDLEISELRYARNNIDSKLRELNAYMRKIILECKNTPEHLPNEIEQKAKEFKIVNDKLRMLYVERERIKLAIVECKMGEIGIPEKEGVVNG